MIDYSDFFDYLKTTSLSEVVGDLELRVRDALRKLSHGDFDRWAAAIEAMPEVAVSEIDLAKDAVTVAGEISDAQRSQLKQQLMEMHPWRKGPFDLFGIHIESEWRSDLKWARLPFKQADASGGTASPGAPGKPWAPSTIACRSQSPMASSRAGKPCHPIQRRLEACVPLKDKLILDIGCGNGYYLFRMLGAGAKAAVGVDPFMLYVTQFQAINQYIQTNRAAVLPLGLDDLPAECGCFDCVFSMGVLYHRRNAQQHPAELFGFLTPGGQLVLETIVQDKAGEELLVPDGRYAKMRNVWAIPTPRLLETWLADAGYTHIETIDVTKTTPAEQRCTDWMTFESLPDFLDPADASKTIEGYPAPVRAIVLAQKP